MKDYQSMLPTALKDIEELKDVCAYIPPENVAHAFRHFLAFKEQMKAHTSIEAEVIEGMFTRLGVTPSQIKKAITESLIEWN